MKTIICVLSIFCASLVFEAKADLSTINNKVTEANLFNGLFKGDGVKVSHRSAKRFKRGRIGGSKRSAHTCLRKGGCFKHKPTVRTEASPCKKRGKG